MYLDFPCNSSVLHIYWQVILSQTLNTNIFRKLHFPVIWERGDKSTKIKMTLQNSLDNGVERQWNGMFWNLILVGI